MILLFILLCLLYGLIGGFILICVCGGIYVLPAILLYLGFKLESSIPIMIDNILFPVLPIIIPILLIIGAGLLIIGFIGKRRIFKKMGEKGRKAIIPFLNVYIVYKKMDIGIICREIYMKCKKVNIKKGLPGNLSPLVWLLLFLLLVFVILPPQIGGIILYLFFRLLVLGILILIIMPTYMIPRKFGRSKFASVFYVIFSPICIPILGFGDYKYDLEVINENKDAKEINNQQNNAV